MVAVLTSDEVIECFNRDVDARVALYESVKFIDCHPNVLERLPGVPANILDIGAGSGRDAAFFANLGYSVTAVEPAIKMFQVAPKLHSNHKIEWINDSLPSLKSLSDREEYYDVVFISAVWMYLSDAVREKSLAVVNRLLKPSGKLIITYKVGEKEGKDTFQIDDVEFDRRAIFHGFKLFGQSVGLDSLGRNELYWRCCTFIKD